METPPRKHLHHRTPDWVRPESIYFVTVCTEPRGTNHFCHESIGLHVLSSIRHYHENESWFCHLATLMPDHIHLLLSFPPDQTLSQIVGLWRRWLARHHSISWQTNFFEYRLRSDDNFQQKVDYILHNPVRAGLIEQPHNWPYSWTPPTN